MLLKDLINQQRFCWFEINNDKFLYNRNGQLYIILEKKDYGVKSSRLTIAFYELNREKEVKIIKLLK